MGVDLLAGLGLAPLPPLGRAPRVLVFDSGLGGLTVLAELVKAIPGADFVYAADDAGFPYGALDDQRLVARVVAVMERLVAREVPDLVVVACNTASTLALPALRARFALPFVGTVPAVKPAVAASITGLVTVLATPGTVRREHTRAMIDAFAGKAEVTLVGAPNLAAYAEAELRGAPVDDALMNAEIAPCFVERRDGARTDVVALACTHFPLLTRRFEAVAPWPVTWIDPAPAIARRAVALVGEQPADLAAPSRALFTSERPLPPPLALALSARGLAQVEREHFPLR
ncbi:glutamate racemase [Hansschlegelia zhihuaiae]|uniref:Glutamate racemase n=1 Tax=Hansschlegelia zhihuaiae TaxID=405005 RepID=A0A4Q0MJ87_9HYPH|nr:glutamate racemase [Hansschlegelia zhihuaiae]RXF73016.1 glutamate racemase [Hansschlegelia zhihuaiae]